MFFRGARKKNSKIYLLISIYLFTYNVGSAIFGRVTVTVHATNLLLRGHIKQSLPQRVVNQTTGIYIL